LDILGVLIDAGGEVAGVLLNAKPRLLGLLKSLKARGLVFEYRGGSAVTWTAHPFLREKFSTLLGCPQERVFDVVAKSLGSGLEKRPQQKPREAAILDRFEPLIEATLLAGREHEAFDLYWYGVGNFQNLGWRLGEYQRGYRILAQFPSVVRPELLIASLTLSDRAHVGNDLALFAYYLGRLGEAREIRQRAMSWYERLANPIRTSIVHQNLVDIEISAGRLVRASDSARVALNSAAAARSRPDESHSLAVQGYLAHRRGDHRTATETTALARASRGSELTSVRGARYARCLCDRGDLSAAKDLCAVGIRSALASDSLSQPCTLLVSTRACRACRR
jgi:hypothetical protein